MSSKIANLKLLSMYRVRYSLLSNFLDVSYFVKFSAIFLILYLFNQLYVGLLIPGGFYSPFLKEYLNYPSWIIHAVLFFSNGITHLTGIHSYISTISLKVDRGSTVNIYWPCIGLQIMSFWTAFVMADYSRWRNKLRWWIAGISGIIIINSFRIALLLIAMEKEWEVDNIDHHTMFTWAAYVFITLLTYIYYKMNRPSKAVTLQG